MPRHRAIAAWIVRAPLVLAAATLAVPAPAAAADAVRAVPFAKGQSAARLQGRVQGYDSMDYTLRASAGQTLTVSMTASRASAYFNVMPPGSKDVAIHVGSTLGNQFTGTLAQSGEYRIRVYQMRSDARRGASANFTLDIAITGAANPQDAKVAGTPFHATGQVPCTLGAAAPAMCDFGVIRSQPGHAEVRITPAGTTTGGAARRLVFAGSQVTSPGARVIQATHQGDEWQVELDGGERYRIPDAVINGG